MSVKRQSGVEVQKHWDGTLPHCMAKLLPLNARRHLALFGIELE
jgi:hypothetical protein